MSLSQSAAGRKGQFLFTALGVFRPPIGALGPFVGFTPAPQPWRTSKRAVTSRFCATAKLPPARPVAGLSWMALRASLMAAVTGALHSLSLGFLSSLLRARARPRTP